jgi:BirA family biotin operon repressor/biotin-[acetyl-CoA-carboxylase] ligase
LYTSFLLRPRIDASRWLVVTPLVALAVAEALDGLRDPAGEADRSMRLMIKWPNDVCGRHGKLAGILAETEEGSVVVGLGLNLSQRCEEFPAEFRDRASSLRLEGYDPVPGREAVLCALDLALGRSYRRLHEGDAGFLRRGLLDRFHLEGRRVRIGRSGGAVVEGIARGIGDCGELILETADGPRTVVSGEVVWIGPPAA